MASSVFNTSSLVLMYTASDNLHNIRDCMEFRTAN